MEEGERKGEGRESFCIYYERLHRREKKGREGKKEGEKKT